MKQKRLTQTLLAAITSFGLIGGAYAAEERSYILATASTGGTYYPVGVALATLTKVKLTPSYHFSLSAISSAGSGENVKLMNDNEAQFAILQGLYGAWAWAGEGPYAERQNQLRSVSMLWQNVEHFIVRSDLAPILHHCRSGQHEREKVFDWFEKLRHGIFWSADHERGWR